MTLNKLIHYRLTLPAKSYRLQTALGFTLIELLVTFSLISIISGIGFASFASYSRRQTVVQAAADLKQAVDLARFDAVSSVKPSDCSDTDTLSSYQVNFCQNSVCNTSGVDYEVVAQCGAITKVVESKKLPDNVTFSSVGGQTVCSTVKFNTLSSIAEGAPCQINVNGFSNQVKVTLDSNGYVSY
ncbi:MAG TPA: prepilin-type N-terminal cleavage/methylation domain-containing protein [Patescibacteria group bacterium]|nr:prepilin-type N-terminal cleavage/methylation domain-containing protein [Patescibacteria group bacterium]